MLCEDSILGTIKSLMPGSLAWEDDVAFDNDLITYINTTIAILNHEGVGKPNFQISSFKETWNDFISRDDYEDEEVYFETLSIVPTYIRFKVKTMFDPATSNTLKQVEDETLKELEWRLYSLANYQNN